MPKVKIVAVVHNVLISVFKMSFLAKNLLNSIKTSGHNSTRKFDYFFTENGRIQVTFGS